MSGWNAVFLPSYAKPSYARSRKVLPCRCRVCETVFRDYRPGGRPWHEDARSALLTTFSFASGMIPQLKFQRMRIQVVLPLQVRLIVFSHIMIYERDGNDEGKVSRVVGGYQLSHFLLFIA